MAGLYTQLLPTQFSKTSPSSPEKLCQGLWGILFSSWLKSKAGFSQSEDGGSGGPPGSRSSHQGLISGSGYLKVWLRAGENNPHWVLGYLRAAQLVWAAARSWLTLCAENEAARLCLQLQAWRCHPRRDVRKEESGSLPVRTTPVWRRCEVSLGNREKSP